MKEYPECEKQAKIKDKAQVCGEFLEYLRSHGYVLAVWQHRGAPEPGGYDELIPTRESIEHLLAGFFEINLAKVEQECRAMLDEIRAQG